MLKEKSWDEFRDTGLMLIINQLLHVFGWAIAVEVGDDGNTTRCFPARTKFRGFGEESVDRAYRKVSKYMNDNSSILLEETMDEILSEPIAEIDEEV